MKVEFSWTSHIGLARSLLAAGTLLTLLFNPLDFLVYVPPVNHVNSLNINLFFLLADNLAVAKIISIIILLFVISGYFPFVTGVLHWFVTYSFFKSCNIIDGGDQVSAILTLLLIPITLTDKRKNHWKENVYEADTLKALISKTAFTLIKIQVCAIYLHAFVGKIPVDEWLNGTAAYYWLTHEYFGVNEVLRPVYNFFLTNAFFVTLVTWGTLIFEFALSSAIFVDNKKIKLVLFILGFLFHFFILITHGLVTFFLAMTSALILYVLPNQLNALTIKEITKCRKKLLLF